MKKTIVIWLALLCSYAVVDTVWWQMVTRHMQQELSEIRQLTQAPAPPKKPLTLKDAFYCGKSTGIHESHPEITYWGIRSDFRCDEVDQILKAEHGG